MSVAPTGCRTTPPRWPGSTASPASPGTWRWAPSSMPAPTSTRSGSFSTASPCRGGSCRSSGRSGAAWPARGPWCAGESDAVVRTHAHIVGLITDAALPPRVTERALAVFRRLAEVESALHRRPVERGALPRGRRARRHHRHRRHRRRARSARRRRGHRVGRGHRHRDGAHRPRAAAQPLAGRRPPARGRADLRARHHGGAHHARPAPRCWPPCPPRSGRCRPWWWPASGFGGGAGELDELPNCTQVVIGQRDGAADIGSGATGPGARDQPRRRDRGTARPRRVGRPRGGRVRRLGQPGHHEEGPARPRPARPHRRGAPRLAAPRHRTPPPAPSGSAPRRSSAGRRPAPSTRSPSMAWWCA